MTDDDVKDMIKSHEGYRDSIYMDTVGVPTGGYGHAFLPGSALPKILWEMIFNHDYQTAVKDYESLNLNLDPVRRAVVIDMLFNLGKTKFLGFKNTLTAIRAGNFEDAAYCMGRSKWAGQVGNRAKRLIQMMRTGEVA